MQKRNRMFFTAVLAVAFVAGNCRCRGRWNRGLPFLQEAKREKAF